MEEKKHPKLVLERKRGQFFAIGLTMSLALAIMAFEWKSPAAEMKVLEGDLGSGFDEEMVFITKIPPPEPPKPKVVPLQVVETKEEIEPPEIHIDVELKEFDPGEEIVIPAAPIEEVEIIHDRVEEMPAPEGGLAAFYGFLSKHMQYPKQARRMGIEGIVFVQFVVDKSGQLSDLTIARGIGAGCDEEALRVMGIAPAWSPGKQRGRPVKVKMMVPIHFRLHN